MKYAGIVPITPFPIPLTTPPETIMYLVIAGRNGAEAKEIICRQEKFRGHATIDAGD